MAKDRKVARPDIERVLSGLKPFHVVRSTTYLIVCTA